MCRATGASVESDTPKVDWRGDPKAATTSEIPGKDHAGLPNLWEEILGNIRERRQSLAEESNHGEVKRRGSFLELLFNKPSDDEDVDVDVKDHGNDDNEVEGDSTEENETQEPPALETKEAESKNGEGKRRGSFLELLFKPSDDDMYDGKVPEEDGVEDIQSSETEEDKQEIDKGPENDFWKNLFQKRDAGEKDQECPTEKPEGRKPNFWENLFQKKPNEEKDEKETCTTLVKSEQRKRNFWEEIWHDCTQGDKKILRAIGRTALVNATVAAAAVTGGAFAPVAGYAAGGAITANRLGQGVAQDNPKEVVKSLAVFGCATTASLTGQAVTGAVMLAVVGASLPVAAAAAFGVGCVSGITAGALSEWGVDHACQGWSRWLRLQSQNMQTIQAATGSDYIGQRQLMLDVSMNLLCGSQSHIVKEALVRGKGQAVHTDSSSGDSESVTEPESDSEEDGVDYPSLEYASPVGSIEEPQHLHRSMAVRV